MIAGLSLGWDFLLHGLATFIVFFFFVFHDSSHLLAPMLLMEVRYGCARYQKQVLVLLLDTFTLTSPLYLGLYNIFDASSV